MFCIPPRTEVRLRINVDDESTEAQIAMYECVDCGLQTSSLEEMLDHQEYQADHHTIWQRIKRFFA